MMRREISSPAFGAIFHVHIPLGTLLEMRDFRCYLVMTIVIHFGAQITSGLGYGFKLFGSLREAVNIDIAEVSSPGANFRPCSPRIALSTPTEIFM